MLLYTDDANAQEIHELNQPDRKLVISLTTLCYCFHCLQRQFSLIFVLKSQFREFSIGKFKFYSSNWILNFQQCPLTQPQNRNFRRSRLCVCEILPGERRASWIASMCFLFPSRIATRERRLFSLFYRLLVDCTPCRRCSSSQPRGNSFIEKSSGWGRLFNITSGYEFGRRESQNLYEIFAP